MDVVNLDTTHTAISPNDSQISLYPWLFEQNDEMKLDNQMLAGQLTLYPWIFEAETRTSVKSRLGRLKKRLARIGCHILKPFQMLKRCIK